MAAAYPTGIASFISKVNITDIIDASHPNSLQDEMVATQATLGTEPNRSTAPSSGGTFDGTSVLYSTVGLRLNNIEVGVVSDAHTQYLRKVGDSANVITIGTSTVKGLVIKGAASQSANLQDWQNSSATALAKIDSAGNMTAASFVKTSGTSSQFLKADGSIDSSTYLTSSSVSGVYQPIDADLTAIAALTGTSGFLKTNGSSTWTVDTATYLTTSTAATTYQAKFSVNATAKTVGYTLATGDYETMVQVNGTVVLTVGTGLSAAPVGTQIHILALSTGVSVSGSGVTLNGTPGLKLRAAYSAATLICLASNVWVLTGDLSA